MSDNNEIGIKAISVIRV